MFCCLLDSRRPADVAALDAVARACSPRVERRGDGVIVFDLIGLDRVLGPPPVIAVEVERLAAAHGLTPRFAIAGTMTAAWLLAHARSGVTVVPVGQERLTLAKLGIQTLAALTEEGTGHWALGTGKKNRSAECRMPTPEYLHVFLLWGLHTLGDLARLPEADVRTRLGAAGIRLHQAACGLDAAPLVPAAEARRFVERLELEWPIEGLEPLSFVLSRLCESLSTALERADRGAVTIATRLRLVTRATHERVLRLPAPMRDARVLRTLSLLDLESHPAGAAIDIVEVELDVTPGRIVQGSLLASRSLPSPEHLSTLIARLRALMGESRVGAPALVDTHDERAVGMGTFTAPDQGRRQKAEVISHESAGASHLRPSVRRFRLPIAITVDLEHGAPVCVRTSARGLSGGRVIACGGPWRSSGEWWTVGASACVKAWDRDEWDVELTDGVYRLARDRSTGRWEIEGVID